jgi:hypothetical protein
MTADLGAVAVRPGGPSAKTFPRAGSPNHQDDSKEGPILAPYPLVNVPLTAAVSGQECPDGRTR